MHHDMGATAVAIGGFRVQGSGFRVQGAGCRVQEAAGRKRHKNRLSASENYLRDLRTSCSMPYGAQVVDPKGETPSALDTRCFTD
jgi:hypothetical protein